jgi:hypothetical protein
MLQNTRGAIANAIATSPASTTDADSPSGGTNAAA